MIGLVILGLKTNNIFLFQTENFLVLTFNSSFKGSNLIQLPFSQVLNLLTNIAHNIKISKF